MRAAVTEAPGRMSIRDDAREPGAPSAGEVVVRPEAVGICGSDFHFYAGELHELVGATLPRVQGHEGAAVVEAVGPDCRDDLVPGARVALWPLSPCGTCRPCRLGRGNVCDNFSLIGIHTDGGLQERLTMPQDQVLPTGVARPEVAGLAEPVSIAVRAVNRGRVAAGERAVVFGAGPLGRGSAAAARAASWARRRWAGGSRSPRSSRARPSCSSTPSSAGSRPAGAPAPTGSRG